MRRKANRPFAGAGSRWVEAAAQPTSEQQAESICEALRCGRSGCHCGRGGIVHCPSHTDSNPSLSVTAKADKVLVHCFSGCTQTALITELKERGLWRVPPAGHLNRFRKRIPGTNARCPDCLHFMWWPDEQTGSVWWWCEHCSRHISPREALVEWYEFPPVPPELRQRWIPTTTPAWGPRIA